MFCGFKVYKELERIVHNLKMDMSVDTVLKIAFPLRYHLPHHHRHHL